MGGGGGSAPAQRWVEELLLSPPPCVRSWALRAPLLGSRLQSSPWALLPLPRFSRHLTRRGGGQGRGACRRHPPRRTHSRGRGACPGMLGLSPLVNPCWLGLVPRRGATSHPEAFFKRKASSGKRPLGSSCLSPHRSLQRTALSKHLREQGCCQALERASQGRSGMLLVRQVRIVAPGY